MTAPAPAPAAGDLLGGKYRLERLLGEGGMGAVWLAEHVEIGRKVAVKMLHARLAGDPELVARFRREARAAAAIGHPAIVDVLDVGTTTTGAPFLVMEWLDGETLGARITRHGRLPAGQVATLGAAALEGLAAAHARGIVHRDLKPDNLMLPREPAGTVRLLDFGIASRLGDDDLDLTRTGQVLGTPRYMSPEQARGARELGPASDLWAMGAVLFHALAGRPPFVGASYNELLAQILADEPPDLATLRAGLPAALPALVRAMLARDPASRPTAADAASRLRAIMATLASDETIEATSARAADSVQPTAVLEARRRREASFDSTLPATPVTPGSAAVAATPALTTSRRRAPALLASGVVAAGAVALLVTQPWDDAGRATGRPPAAAPGAPDARPVDVRPVDARPVALSPADAQPAAAARDARGAGRRRTTPAVTPATDAPPPDAARPRVPDAHRGLEIDPTRPPP